MQEQILLLPSAEQNADVSHLLQKGGFHAAGAQLVHPEGGLVLQGGSSGVEGVAEVVVQQTAERGHIEVREPAEASGEMMMMMKNSGFLF
ncbi:UNVERIFIED_CONTAM: hypothetical protein FKN15_013537 [Acipenser sinensis]